MQSTLFDIAIWTTPLIAVILTYLYLRYCKYGRVYGGGLIAIYGIHQTFCILFLVQSLGIQIASSLLVGPILLLDLIILWPKRGDSAPTKTIGNILAILAVIMWIFASVAILNYFLFP